MTALMAMFTIQFLQPSVFQRFCCFGRHEIPPRGFTPSLIYYLRPGSEMVINSVYSSREATETAQLPSKTWLSLGSYAICSLPKFHSKMTLDEDLCNHFVLLLCLSIFTVKIRKITVHKPVFSS